MDLAKRKENTFPWISVLYLITCSANVTLVLYLITVQITQPGIALQEFKNIRNAFYMYYAVAMSAAGILIFLKRLRQSGSSNAHKPAKTGIEHVVPVIITSLIFTTFSYAIAKLIVDIYQWISGVTYQSGLI